MAPFGVEEKLEELIEHLETDGYWVLVQRDRSAWGSIYVLLYLPPLSQSRPPRKTSYAVRVANHPPRPDREPSLLVSIHPGQDDVKQMWRQAKALMRVDYESKKQESKRLRTNVNQYHQYKDARKKYR